MKVLAKFKKLKMIGLVVMLVASACTAPAAYADDEPVTAAQRFTVNVVEYLEQPTTAQKFVVTVVDHLEYPTATQKFVVTVMSDELELTVVEPNTIHIRPSESDSATVTAQVRYGMNTGYTLNFEFDNSDLTCSADSSHKIPSIAAEGNLQGTMWGYNIVDADGAVPTSYLPIATNTTQWAKTSNFSAQPYDEHFIALGASAGWDAIACKGNDSYGNVMTVTAVAN